MQAVPRLHRSTSAFTLVEVLVVVMVVAVLVAIAVPYYMTYLGKSRRVEGIEMLSTFHKLEMSYYGSYGVFPAMHFPSPSIPSQLGFTYSPAPKYYRIVYYWTDPADQWYTTVIQGQVIPAYPQDQLCIEYPNKNWCGGDAGQVVVTIDGVTGVGP